MTEVTTTATYCDGCNPNQLRFGVHGMGHAEQNAEFCCEHGWTTTADGRHLCPECSEKAVGRLIGGKP